MIAGGGPTGMMFAVELGVGRCRVVIVRNDVAHRTSTIARPLVFMPSRTIELLDQPRHR